jgi:secretion/DNA translocation related CpaE-like protein
MTRRRDVVLIAREPSPECWQNAVALGAEHVVSLPEAERWLIDRLADTEEGPTRNGRIVGVMGAGAGAGASTFAVTLALGAAARSLRVLLVDGDPLAGGLELLLGMEDMPGIRWDDLADSRGRLGACRVLGQASIRRLIRLLSSSPRRWALRSQSSGASASR